MRNPKNLVFAYSLEAKPMFDGKIERELLDGEAWLTEPPSHLPSHIESLLDDSQSKEKQDVWESSAEDTSTAKTNSKIQFLFRFLKLI
jgi:hypothetical protein